MPIVQSRYAVGIASVLFEIAAEYGLLELLTRLADYQRTDCPKVGNCDGIDPERT